MTSLSAPPAAAGRLRVRCQIAARGGDLEAMTAPRPDLDRAFDRIDDFLAVQGAALDLPAVLALQEAVGVDDASRAVIGQRIAALAGAGHRAAAGSVLLGILVGLFAAGDA